MVRKLLAALAILALGMTAAAAQSCDDIVKTRQSLMKRSGEMGKVASSMIKGETPFDLAKTKEVFAAFAEDASSMPTLFPDCSKNAEHSNASPAIWENLDDFKKLMAKFATDVKEAQENTKDLDGLKASLDAIGKDCRGCHERFRIKKS
ncbi:MAG TPA: cytochrome c [Xanthobacteraceae bacterium]|nr:cytochrome c [Xanthobacteraceae bacterium]